MTDETASGRADNSPNETSLPERSPTLCAVCSPRDASPDPCAACELKRELRSAKRDVATLKLGIEALEQRVAELEAGQ